MWLGRKATHKSYRGLDRLVGDLMPRIQTLASEKIAVLITSTHYTVYENAEYRKKFHSMYSCFGWDVIFAPSEKYEDYFPFISKNKAYPPPDNYIEYILSTFQKLHVPNCTIISVERVHKENLIRIMFQSDELERLHEEAMTLVRKQVEYEEIEKNFRLRKSSLRSKTESPANWAGGAVAIREIEDKRHRINVLEHNLILKTRKESFDAIVTVLSGKSGNFTDFIYNVDVHSSTKSGLLNASTYSDKRYIDYQEMFITRQPILKVSNKITIPISQKFKRQRTG